ncbi:hypothetical protein RFM68_31345 [Mesorhizobium sp. MSK_1335]|uniref:Uncharacterized protein n=1 Tax=Mesorhizobium montanum TaxID=3072323 RepID=A0ABU4ZX14_9HYPH|nr:hypothetical protein [Mesorhizobium sp. MSK_1335]MDX8528972.1 hypothetical protein [Mesorhizobium sp. MSK_1335]
MILNLQLVFDFLKQVFGIGGNSGGFSEQQGDDYAHCAQPALNLLGTKI